MNAAPRPRRDVLRATGLFVVAVAGIVLGTVASAHHINSLNALAVAIVGLALGFALAMLGRAYMTGIRIPMLTQPLIAMTQAMEAGQAASGEFKAGLRELAAGVPRTRMETRPGEDHPPVSGLGTRDRPGTRPNWGPVHRQAPDRPHLHRNDAQPSLLLQG
jgi:hypothetical protein